MSADPLLIDLLQGGRPQLLGVYLLTCDEPTLVDCGPASHLDRLRAELERHGVAVADLRHLLLTHVHFDHAGGAGALVAENPSLTVHVSAIGARHLVDPTRLEQSSRRVFGERFDTLWGAMTPVPPARIRVAEGRAAGFECIPTPGHAKHHVAFIGDDGTAFTGDVTGVRIVPHAHVSAATPPPDIDLAAYAASLAAIEARRPRRLCLPHFGIAEDPQHHIELMRESLARWAGWVREGIGEEEFGRRAEAELAACAFDPDVAETIRVAAPFGPCYAGLRRHRLVHEGGAEAASSA